MSRGKEFKGQTLTIDGSRSGASVPVTRLAYDSAFNLELIGEARYGAGEGEPYWYIERLSYDSAFNLTTIQTAQNRRLLGESGNTLVISGNDVTVPTDLFISDLSPGDLVNGISIDSINGLIITLSSPLVIAAPTTADKVTVTLEAYVTKDFNKRAWTLRNLYVYE